MNRLKRNFISFGLTLLATSLTTSWVLAQSAGTTATCARFLTVSTSSTPSYNVMTNVWNGGCSGTQCVTINLANGDFGVTQATFSCGSQVATYPAIYYGCHYGNCSPGTNLPITVSQIYCANSSWSFTPPPSGSWDIAYDIWFCPSGTCSGGYSGGAELMIWPNYMSAGPAGSYKAYNVSIDGTYWNLAEGNIGWNYIAYLATSPITQLNNENILGFIQDSVARGYIQSTWTLSAIEAGIEIHSGGAPYVSSGFSAAVNNPICGTPTFTATPTNTPTSTPCGYPGNTCTPTATPTFTPTPNPNNDIPWPNPWDGSQPLSFYHTLSSPADSVVLKVYSLSFRKVCEVDNLATGQGQPSNWQTTYNLSWSQLGNVANGPYYVVVEERRGGQITRRILKLLVRR